MSNFFSDLPYSCIWNGKEWALTPAYDNVLNMLTQTDDESLSEYDKLDIMLYYLIAGDYPLEYGLLLSATDVLFEKNEQEDDSPRMIDFIQDAELIFAAFYQSYGIDLEKEKGKLHWWKFKALIQGLPSNTRLAEIVQIRSQPLPKSTKYNTKEIQNILRLKAKYGLKISQTEREQNLQNGLRKMAQCLITMTKKEG